MSKSAKNVTSFLFLVVAYIGFSLKTFFGDWFWLGMHAPAWWGLVTFAIVCIIIFFGALRERFNREWREEFYHCIIPREDWQSNYCITMVRRNVLDWESEDFDNFWKYTNGWSSEDLNELYQLKKQEWTDLRDDLRLANINNNDYGHLDKTYRDSAIRMEKYKNYQSTNQKTVEWNDPVYEMLCKKYNEQL